MRKGRRSLEKTPPYLFDQAKEICHGRNSLDGAAGAQPAAGDGAALVLPRPFPSHARPTPLSGKHSFVI
jgi:hypothetical protein